MSRQGLYLLDEIMTLRLAVASQPSDPKWGWSVHMPARPERLVSKEYHAVRTRHDYTVHIIWTLSTGLDRYISTLIRHEYLPPMGNGLMSHMRTERYSFLDLDLN